MDESYWKDPNGEVNEDGCALGDAWQQRKATVTDDPKPKVQAHYCSHCYRDHEPEVKRELTSAGVTERKKLTVWLCEVCDGEALDIHNRML